MVKLVVCSVLLFSLVCPLRPQNVTPSGDNITKPSPKILLHSDTSEEEDNDYQISGTKSRTQSLQESSIPTPPSYKKWELPLQTNKKEKGYTYVSLFIREILDINEKDEEVVLDTDFGLQWVDWKIYEYLKNTSKSNDTIDFEHRVVDAGVLKHIWKPDVYIDEMSSVHQTSVISKLVTLSFLGGTNAGDIMYSARTTFKLRCDMSFEYYPADTQTCQYYIRSYSNNASRFEIMWNEWGNGTYVGIYLNDPSDPNFDIQISSVGPNKPATLYIYESFDDFRKGNYSALTFTLKARRKLSYHLVQTYLPSILLILITWLCFLLPGDMVEARIGISMTTVLTLTAMFAAIRQQSPSVSYTMAIDIWMVFCIFFVFTALLLFTSMYWMGRQYKKEPNPLKKYERRIEFLKSYTFLIFALIFICFLIIYWSWLLIFSNYYDWKLNPVHNGLCDEDKSDNVNHYGYHETMDKDPFPFDPYSNDTDSYSNDTDSSSNDTDPYSNDTDVISTVPPPVRQYNESLKSD